MDDLNLPVEDWAFFPTINAETLTHTTNFSKFKTFTQLVTVAT